MIRIVALLTVTFSALPATAQLTWRWEPANTVTPASLRGLYVVNDKTVWASGAGGTVLRTTDGTHWENVSIAAAAELDFRDIHALDAETALVLSAGSPGRIYRTQDGGKSWKLVYNDPSPKIFFDGMAFWDTSHGLAFGDPIDGRLTLLITDDGGRTWKPIRGPRVPKGLAGFAASGTSLCTAGASVAWIGTGGEYGRSAERRPAIVYRTTDRGVTWKKHEAPLHSSLSSGVFSLAFAGRNTGIAVGGDYRKPENRSGNIAITRDGGRTWSVPSGRPHGYRSCVCVVTANTSNPVWIAVGPTGTDLSGDNGETWQFVDREPYHTVMASPSGRVAWASGPRGKISKAVIP